MQHAQFFILSAVREHKMRTDGAAVQTAGSWGCFCLEHTVQPRAKSGSGILITGDTRNERSSAIPRPQAERAFKEVICSQLFHRKEIGEKNSNILCSGQVGGNCKEPLCCGVFTWKFHFQFVRSGLHRAVTHLGSALLPSLFPALHQAVSVGDVAKALACQFGHILPSFTAAFRRIPHLDIPVALSCYSSRYRRCFKILYSKLLPGQRNFHFPFSEPAECWLPGKKTLCHQVRLALSFS